MTGDVFLSVVFCCFFVVFLSFPSCIVPLSYWFTVLSVCCHFGKKFG